MPLSTRLRLTITAVAVLAAVVLFFVLQSPGPKPSQPEPLADPTTAGQAHAASAQQATTSRAGEGEADLPRLPATEPGSLAEDPEWMGGFINEIPIREAPAEVLELEERVHQALAAQAQQGQTAAASADRPRVQAEQPGSVSPSGSASDVSLPGQADEPAPEVSQDSPRPDASPSAGGSQATPASGTPNPLPEPNPPMSMDGIPWRSSGSDEVPVESQPPTRRLPESTH